MTRAEVPYDDRLITCPECRSTFEAADGTVLDLARHDAEVLRAAALAIPVAAFRDGTVRTFLMERADRIAGDQP